MANVLCNGFVAYITSVASRRSVLVGEHIHRLFEIPVKNIPARNLAKEAFGTHKNDLKKYFLEGLQVLIEEVSLIQAELWATIDMVLQMMKTTDQQFSGALITTNGDCCQLLNVPGKDIFQSSGLIFTFKFHFLVGPHE